MQRNPFTLPEHNPTWYRLVPQTLLEHAAHRTWVLLAHPVEYCSPTGHVLRKENEAVTLLDVTCDVELVADDANTGIVSAPSLSSSSEVNVSSSTMSYTREAARVIHMGPNVKSHEASSLPRRHLQPRLKLHP